jgi:hypothetical protein
MRKTLWFAAAAMLALPASGWCQQAQPQQQNQSQSSAPSTQSTAPAQTPTPGTSSQSSGTSQAGQVISTPAPHQESLAESARKIREQKKDAPKAAKVFTNDNLPTGGGISSVGPASEAAPATTAAAGASASTSGKTSSSDDEKQWRDKFAGLRNKLAQDQTALDVMQRELNVDAQQYYGGDPNKAYQDQTSMQPMGAEYTKKSQEIEAKKKDIAADQQALDDAEEDLRKAGGDPGWAR